MKRASLRWALVVALLGALGWWTLARPTPYRNSLRARELATWGLADHLAAAFPGERALVFSNPFSQRKGTAKEIVAAETAGLRGLKRGFAAKVSLAAVVFPELRPNALDHPRSWFIDRETTTPLSYLVAPEAFDAAVAQHPDCRLVVSLIGLPVGLERIRCWQEPGGPHFALLWPDLRIIGNAAAVEQALRGGKLAAFVLPKPGAVSADAPLHGANETEFARRYVLVTRSNFGQVLQTFPGLLPR